MEKIEFDAITDARNIMFFVESEYYKPKEFARLETEFEEKYGQNWKNFLSNSEDY